MTETPSTRSRLRTSRPLSALWRSLRLLRANTHLFVAGFVLALVSGVIAVFATNGPIEDMLISRAIGLLVIPLVWLGFLTVVVRARTNSTRSVREALTASKDRYAPLVGGYALVKFAGWGSALFVVLGMTPLAAFIYGYTRPVNQSYGLGNNGRLDLLTYDYVYWLFPVLVLGLLVAAIVTYYLQFYDLEVLLNGAGPREALRNSRHLVRENHRAVFGYSVIRLGAQYGFGIPLVVLLNADRLFAEASLSFVLGVALVALVVSWLVDTVFATYHIMFYDTLTP